MYLNLQEVFLQAPTILGLIGCVYFLVFYPRFSFLGKIIGYFICFTAACELTGHLTADYNNLYILHIYTLGAFLFSSFFFFYLFQILQWNYLKKEYIYLGGALIVLNTLLFQWIDVYNSYSKTSSQFIIIGLCILAYSLLTLRKYPYSDGAAIKVFIAAILISSTASISLYLFSHQIMAMEKETQRTIWMINAGTNIIVQILFLWGCFKIVQLPLNAPDS